MTVRSCSNYPGLGDGYYRIDWDASFNITEAPLTADGYAVAYYDNLNFRPYLGDGYMYIPVNGDGAAMLYSPTPAAAENTAPDGLAAPRVIADRSTGGVKVEWDAGSDRESATEDLDYEVSMSGASALYRAMTGGNTFVFADAGTWLLEDVSVRVRALRPLGHVARPGRHAGVRPHRRHAGGAGIRLRQA